MLENITGGDVGMRKNFGAKPWVYPQPVFIVATYDNEGNPNAMNAAWGGIHDDDEIFICMGANHKTSDNLEARKAFTVSIGDVSHMVECDYVGIESGLKVPDKFKKAGFTATKSEFVDAPIINELPMAFECDVLRYDREACRLVGKIKNVSIDERVLTSDDKVDVAKLAPIIFDGVNHTYLQINEKPVGKAFHDGAKLK